MPKIGKISLDAFEKIVTRRLGATNKNILVPPQTGVDAAVIDIGDDNVLVIAEDPIFPVPQQPLDTFGWYIVHIGASDIAVMGVDPEYMTYSLLMPPETTENDLTNIVDSIHETAKDLNICICGGHTGYYPTVNTPIIGGVTVWGITGKNSYVTPKGAEIGDKIILTKGPAIEATGLLAIIYEEELRRELPDTIVEKAKDHLHNMTVVKDALTAMACGVTAMHDATEGGVIGGLFEIAHASNRGMRVEEEKIVCPDEVKRVMEFLNIDPLEAISEGTLLITAPEEHANNIVTKLKRENISSSIIGDVVPKEEGRTIMRHNGKEETLRIPEQDPFWPAFFKGLE